jgi:hypothetical protein
LKERSLMRNWCYWKIRIRMIDNPPPPPGGYLSSLSYCSQCCGSGVLLTPKYGRSFFRIRDLGTKNHISESFVKIFWVKKYLIIYFLCQWAQIGAVPCQK